MVKILAIYFLIFVNVSLAFPHELINQLGSDLYEVRRDAYQSLWRQGVSAKKQVEAGLTNKDPEIALRCRELYDNITVEETWLPIEIELTEECTAGQFYNKIGLENNFYTTSSNKAKPQKSPELKIVYELYDQGRPVNYQQATYCAINDLSVTKISTRFATEQNNTCSMRLGFCVTWQHTVNMYNITNYTVDGSLDNGQKIYYESKMNGLYLAGSRHKSCNFNFSMPDIGKGATRIKNLSIFLTYQAAGRLDKREFSGIFIGEVGGADVQCSPQANDKLAVSVKYPQEELRKLFSYSTGKESFMSSNEVFVVGEKDRVTVTYPSLLHERKFEYKFENIDLP